MKKVSTSQDRIKELMQIKDISQTDISKKTGIAKATISYYINGKREPRGKSIELISRAYGVNPSWLMGYDVPRSDTVYDIHYDMRPEYNKFQEVFNFITQADETQLKRLKRYIKLLDEEKEEGD